MKVVNRHPSGSIFKEDAVNLWLSGKGIFAAYSKVEKRVFILRYDNQARGPTFYWVGEIPHVLKEVGDGEGFSTLDELWAHVDAKGWRLHYFRSVVAFSSWLGKVVDSLPEVDNESN